VPSTEARSFRIDLPSPDGARRCHRLARALASTPGPAGVVFEAVFPFRSIRVIVRPAHLAAGVSATPSSADPAEASEVVPPAPRPPPGWVDRVGVTLPRSSVVPWRPDIVRSSDPDPLGPAVAEGWLALQTFWLAGRLGELCAVRRFRFAAPDRANLARRIDLVARRVAEAWADAIGGPATAMPGRARARRGWRRRTVSDVPRGAWVVRDASAIVATVEPGRPPLPEADCAAEGHEVVFGSSGAGKTTYLAHRAAATILRGGRVVAIDQHGDLAPAIVARLDPAARPRVVAVDAGERPVAGIAALSGDPDDDRAASLFVAAVRRLTSDGSDLYWGFRLERIFDSFVRIVGESGGSLLDLYDLLTSPERRDAARLATRRPALRRFLEELEPVVRRNPEFLWSAATRLSKVVLVPALAELLAPADGGLPVEALVTDGRSLLVRLPLARLGPEAAGFAGTLVLARVFLGLVALGRTPAALGPVLVVLDEVQGFSPPLVAELLAEGRKFGLRAIVATQYPERLTPELRAAAAGASTRFVAFRVPPPSAVEAGAWLGLGREDAPRVLPDLRAGFGVLHDPARGGPSSLDPVPRSGEPDERPWAEAVGRSRPGDLDAAAPELPFGEDAASARLLLAVLAAEEAGRPVGEATVVRSARELPGPPLDDARLTDAWRTVCQRGWVVDEAGAIRLTPAGARSVGLGAPTDAVRESSEHRRLLLAAFRVFARRGYRIEILRQGRFDTTLPDARFRQLPCDPTRTTPEELTRTIERMRGGWAWRYFRGRDVHIEAEVSGALRPERVRHGYAKARAREAFALFVVGDATRARRVRAALARAGVDRDRATVWTLVGPGTSRDGGPKP
jgi:hypothetical protein